MDPIPDRITWVYWPVVWLTDLLPYGILQDSSGKSFAFMLSPRAPPTPNPFFFPNRYGSNMLLKSIQFSVNFGNSIYQSHLSIAFMDCIYRSHPSIFSAITFTDGIHRLHSSIALIDRVHRSHSSMEFMDRIHRSHSSMAFIDPSDRLHSSIAFIDQIN